MNLTKPQKMIWDMEQFAGGSVAVICTSILRHGQPEEGLLQNVIDMLFSHNEVLRTRIQKTDSGIIQYIEAYSHNPAEVLHFSDVAQLQKYAEQYAKTALDLSGILCEIKILYLPDQYGLLVKIHHLLADAWTMALLANQFHMLMEGKLPQFGSFQHFIERETAYINSRRYAADKCFFENIIKEADAPTYICQQQAYELAAERECFVIPAEVATRIHSFAESSGCSVFSVFSTILACYISRLNANAEQVYIGTTVLNRINEEEMHTVGMFVNTVPMPVSIGKHSSFQNALDYAEDILMSLFRHQQYNYSHLLRDVEADRSFTGRLFDVILNYMNAEVVDSQQETQCMWHHNGIQNESLQIHLDDRNHQGILHATYDYQTAKFTRRDIQNLHFHLMNMLLDGIEHPQKDCHTLKMLAPEEEYQLLFELNNTAKEYPIEPNSTAADLFEKNAKRNLEKTCIYIDGKQISYSTLLQGSRSIDVEIRKKVGSSKTVVAVIADRSLQMYCAIYGIIRGGNAYLPILPDTPKERIAYFLKNSGTTLVLAQEEYLHLVTDVSCINLTLLMREPSVTEKHLDCAATPEDTAYVMYTSGSTGTPKGVKISHDALVNRILWMNEAYPLNEDGIILQKTVYTFDVSVWEIFWWGMCGGAMAVSRPGEHAVPVRILDEVWCSRVTHIHFVPSVFDVFLNYLEANKEEQKKFSSVKHVFLSGEKLDASLVSRFYNLYSYTQVHLHNLYGPTECTVDVTYYDCQPTDTTIPIGKPIYNTQIYITDQRLNLLPIGIKGELLIGGRNVGQGYINAPELTQERFVENPYGKGKLYKTGDLTCLREDGEILFCGRMDSQIKINGQRIEPGEIESVIKSVPAVEAAVVILREYNQRKKLIAFYCSRKPIEADILAVCQEKLPHYMIPHLVRMDSLPMHANGKLNRRKLAEMELEPSGHNVALPPEDALEAHICKIFSRVLNQKSVGRNSNFFSLGGDSLAAMTVLAEIGYAQVSAAQFMDNPTPARLATLIKGRQEVSMKYVQTIHKPERIRNAYILFPFAGGDAWIYTELAKAINRIDTETALYFVPFLHSVFECEEAAEEIALLAKETNVSVYSHCAGSAVALRILQSIEQKHGPLIKHYYAAGIIPFPTIGSINGWNFTPDIILLQILKKAGAPDVLFRGNDSKMILKSFRVDTDFSTRFFSSYPHPINCPVTLLLGKRDLFTRFCGKAENRWKKYARHIENVLYIETENHYFHSEDSDTVAKILLSD